MAGWGENVREEDNLDAQARRQGFLPTNGSKNPHPPFPTCAHVLQKEGHTLTTTRLGLAHSMVYQGSK